MIPSEIIMTKTIITVQHPEAEHHINGMIGAWGDWELTEKGVSDAEKIGSKLAEELGKGKAVIYSSDLKRASKTAEIIGSCIDAKPIVLDVLREVNAGKGNGKSRAWYYINKDPNPEHYNPDYKPFDDAESDRDLWRRLEPFYKEIISNDCENIIVVSHETTLCFLNSMLFGDKFEDFEKRRFIGDMGSVSRFETDGEHIMVCCINRNI